MSSKSLDQQTIIKILRILCKNHNNTSTELIYHNQFQLLIAIILSAQSTDKGVNNVTIDLFKYIKKPDDIIKLGLREFTSKIKKIGLFNSKASNIFSTSNILKSEFFSKVPKDFDKLINLPGVGRKTANVYLNLLFDEPRIGVDTHVFRVSNRIGLTQAKNTLQSERQLNERIPQKYKKLINSVFIELGRKYCKSRKPTCEKCSINDNCMKLID
jgi:endonuclease-3